MKKLICSVRGCKRNSVKHRKHTFFSIPNNPDLRKQWIKFADTNIYFKKILVCSDHFTSECLWEKDGKLLISNLAVPTLFPPPINTVPDLNTKLKNRKGKVKNARAEDPFFKQEIVPSPDIAVVETSTPEPQTFTNNQHFFFIDSQGSHHPNHSGGITKIESSPKIEGIFESSPKIDGIFESDYVTEINGYTSFSTEMSWNNPVVNVSGNISVNPETQVNNDDQRSVVSHTNSLDNSIMQVSQAAEEFFQDIEQQMKLKIPPYLKNALIYTGYDNAASLKNLNDSDFEEMQNFVRNQFAELFSSRHMLLEEYFGIFSHNIKQFQILPGHKKLLLAISSFLSNKDVNHASKSTSRHIIKIEG